LTEITEDQGLKRMIRRSQNIGNAPLVAVIPEGLAVGLEIDLVPVKQRPAYGDLGHVVVLAVQQPQVAHQLRLQFLGAEDLQDVDVQMPAEEKAEVAAAVEEGAEAAPAEPEVIKKERSDKETEEKE
jgi:hypothetical protein